MDEIERQMNQVKWSYAESDPDALAELKRRIEDTGRRGSWITYSELVSEVVFHLPNVNKGQPFKINTDAWIPLDRDIIGEFLGYISTLSYRMVSAARLTAKGAYADVTLGSLGRKVRGRAAPA